MSRHWLFAGGLLAIGFVLLALVNAREPGPITRIEKDVIFAQVGDETLRLDLHLPNRGEPPYPAVVCLHGGGWVSGSRKQMTQTLAVLARRGYVAVAPDYRLAPQHRWPACLEDCKAAVRWLRGNAGKYQIDPDRIGIMGLSAGGHLACLLGVTEASDGLEGTAGHGDRTSKVQAVVSFAAPTDLTADELQIDEVRIRNLMPLFNGTLDEKRDDYRKASPALYQVRNPPPFLIVHGASDAVVPISQARNLVNVLRQAGGQAQVIELEGEGQTWAGSNLTRSIDRMLTFLDGVLKQ